MLQGIFSPTERVPESMGPPDCRTLVPVAASVWRRPWGVLDLDDAGGRLATTASGSWLAWSGRAWWRGGASETLNQPLDAEVLLDRLLTKGTAAIEDVDGTFAVAWFDARQRSLCLARDRFGSEPLHYSIDRDAALFASRALSLRELTQGPWELGYEGLRDYLVYGYCPGQPTLVGGVRRVLPGTVVRLELRDGRVNEAMETWYRPSYRDQPLTTDRAIIEAFAEVLDGAVRRGIGGERPAVMISGGMDSSAVASIMRQHTSEDIRTFSFRCGGQAFDESEFARMLANELRTQHLQLEFTEDDALEFADGIRAMDCPFSDAGIEIGTWLVAKAASGTAGYILTGDGGDEFWGSHPVYAAHRLMRAYDALPLGLGTRRWLKRSLNRVSDSDRKRDLRVVAKRLLPDPDLPRALRHIRWKVYYDAAGLRQLVRGVAMPDESAEAFYGSMLGGYDGFDGPTGSLDAMLYNDYYTASTFYLSRLMLFRSQGVVPRMPFFDTDLVAVGARIPLGKKLEGVERTKRLFRQAMRGVVPDIILDRKDKLGHSVPMKNWLRNRGRLYEQLSGVVLEELAGTRGLVDRPTAERMLMEHVTARENHSHRLWALYVLETWLQAHVDGPGRGFK